MPLATIAMLALAASIYAALRLFTGFSFYDDEGSLVLMSRWMADGHPVYRDFQSIYGPFYYLYKALGHAATGGLVSHATGRLIAIFPWVLTSVLVFGYTLRATRSRIAALAAWLVILRMLAFIAAEPGHPQEICVLLVTALIAVMATRLRPMHFAAAGALVAALTLTKINIGVYSGAGVLLVSLAAMRAGRTRAILFGAMAALCLAAPVCLMAPLLGAPDAGWVRSCCALITASILPVIAILTVRRPDRVPGARQWRAVAAGFAGCTALVLAWAMAQGASLADVVSSSVLANLRDAHTWTVPLFVGPAGALATVAGLGAAGLWLYGARDVSARWIAWLKLTIGIATVGLALRNSAELAFALAFPFIWMVMLPPKESAFRQFPRALLAAVTVLGGLYVYPVAASQLRFTMVLLAIVATISVHDAVLALTAGWTWTEARRKHAQRLLAALPVAAYLLTIFTAVQVYRRLSPLDLPGTTGIHIDPDQRDGYQWVVHKVNQGCDSFVSFPAMHSFYMWTGKVPPVYPDVDGWQPYLSRERQAVERRMLEGPRSCVVFIDYLVPFWLLPEDTPDRTLLSYIQEKFVEVDRRGDFHFLVRR